MSSSRGLAHAGARDDRRRVGRDETPPLARRNPRWSMTKRMIHASRRQRRRCRRDGEAKVTGCELGRLFQHTKIIAAHFMRGAWASDRSVFQSLTDHL
jgi:hypothetical protein